MDLFKLEPDYWQATGTLIEGYTSLIWTTRYSDAGEFQLKTPQIKETLAAIPAGSFITSRQDPTIMIVQNHSIDVNDDGVEELTVTGKSFETFLANRFLVGDPGVPWEMLQDYTVHDAIGVIIWNAFCNNILGPTIDVAGAPRVSITKEYDVIKDSGSGIKSVNIKKDILLQSAGGGSSDPEDLSVVKTWMLQSGDAYKYVLDFLRLANLGIRAERSLAQTNVTGPVFTVSNTGVVSNPSSSHVERIVFTIYNGRIRTQTPAPSNPLTPVVFRTDVGHIESPKYLLSKEGFKNNVYVTSSDSDFHYHDPKYTDAYHHVGINRWSGFLDLGDISTVDVDPVSYLLQQGQLYLRDNNYKMAVDGAVSVNVPQKFGVDYFLGDVITVIGQYGVTEDMRVIEYVRTEDEQGDRGYPTLIQAESTPPSP